jgi:hypothetical protein
MRQKGVCETGNDKGVLRARRDLPSRLTRFARPFGEERVKIGYGYTFFWRGFEVFAGVEAE